MTEKSYYGVIALLGVALGLLMGRVWYGGNEPEPEAAPALPPVRQGEPVGFRGSSGKIVPVIHSNQIDHVRIFAPPERANVGSFKGAAGEIITNTTTNRIHPSTIVVASETPIIDLAYVAYSRDLAERTRWPADYVDDMPGDIAMVHLQARTEGGELVCRLGMLVKKDLGLNVPPRPFAKHITHGGGLMGFNFPMPNQVYPETFWNYPDEDRAYWGSEGGRRGAKSLTSYMVQNYFVYAGLRPPSDDKFRGSLQTVFLKSYYPYYFRDLDYIEVGLYCPDIYSYFSANEMYIFAKKRGAGPAGAQTVLRDEADGGFHRFRIPRAFRDRVRPAFKDFGPSYYQTIHAHFLKLKELGVGEHTTPLEALDTP